MIKNKIFACSIMTMLQPAARSHYLHLPSNSEYADRRFTGMATSLRSDFADRRSCNRRCTRQTFAAKYGNGNKIPASLIDPVAKNIQA